jgi:hypothetical protein
MEKEYLKDTHLKSVDLGWKREVYFLVVEFLILFIFFLTDSFIYFNINRLDLIQRAVFVR